MAIGTYISITTLNANDLKWLNAPTKRHRLAEWIQNKTLIYAVYKKPTSDLKTESERMEKYILCKWETKKAGVTILISDKIDHKIKIITDKEDLYIMIKVSI